MAQLSFKSVGETKGSSKFAPDRTFDLPYGISTPLQPGDGHLFEMSYNMKDQIHDNLKNLIMTNYGERLGQYSFGANLQPLLTERIAKEDFDNIAIQQIKNAVLKFMPFIDLKYFESHIDDFNDITNSTRIVIIMTYDIKKLGISDKKIGITLLPIC